MKSCLFCSATLLYLPMAALSAPVTYVDLTLGVGIHVLEESDQGAASKLIKVGTGVQWTPFLSTQLGVWSWNSKAQSDRASKGDSEQDKVGLFDGLSASWEVVLQWPIDNKGSVLSSGPYYRYGQHCWSAVLMGLVEPWSKKGCSELNTVGFSFPLKKAKNEGAYIEFTRTEFDDLSSSSLQLGAKLAF
ncbi:MAG: hypothetical protein ACI9EX_000041 [Oleispira sp.]|jgi:hypothetical protein